MELTALLAPYLPYFWIFFIGLFLLYYGIADGIDLGVGMISLFPGWHNNQRHMMVFALKGVWSSNQTWLVVLGGMLFGAFPLFYGLVLSTLYIPFMIMLIGLIFRAIGIDMGEDFQENRFWHLSFAGGSLVAGLGQGLALGGLLSGVVPDGEPGKLWAWASPLTLLVTIALLLGYVMLGALFIVVKTEGELREASYPYALYAAIATAVLSIGVYIWTSMLYPFMLRKWFVFPDALLMAVFPLIAGFCFAMMIRGILHRWEISPLIWSGLMILFSFLGLSVGFFPYMIPSITKPMTIEQAAASPNTLLFMLAVTVILLPIIISYNIYQYWVFRRKVSEEPL